MSTENNEKMKSEAANDDKLLNDQLLLNAVFEEGYEAGHRAGLEDAQAWSTSTEEKATLIVTGFIAGCITAATAFALVAKRFRA